MHDMSLHFVNKILKEGSEVTSFSLSAVCNALYIIPVENLAKLFHDIAASASILCDQVAFRGLELTLVPPKKHGLDSSPQRHK